LFVLQWFHPPVFAEQPTAPQSEDSRNLFRRWGIVDILKNQPPPETETVAPVTVVGSRLPLFKVPFADVPANVSYIPANVTEKDQQDIRAPEPATFQESIRDTEGAIFYDQVGNGVDTVFGLRGFADSSSVVTLLDGVRVNEVDGNGMVYPLINVEDLESIQIDRGSASPIVGSGAFAGVVHLTTRRASPKPVSLFGNLEFSSFHGIRFNQGFSGTVHDRWTPVGGKLTYFFSGGRNVNEGFRNNGEFRITSFNLKTAYELPDGQGRLHFGWKHTSDAVSNPGELTFQQYQDDVRRTLKDKDGRGYRNNIIYFGADKNFWDNRIAASILTSWRYNTSHFFTTSATFPDWTYGFDPNTDRVDTKSRATDLIWQVGYQDEWTSWLGNQSTIGMEFRDASQYDTQEYAFQGIADPSLPRKTDRSATPQSTALFWRESFKLLDQVIVHGGMRHDFYWLNTEDKLTPTDSLSRRYNDSTLSTGITYQPVKWADLFGNYSQGFRVPTISELAPFSGTVSSNLQPVHSDSYEIGTRLRMKDKAAFKFSYFLIDMEDEIAWDSSSVTAASPFGQNINISESRRTGTETRVDVKPLKELSFYGSHTLTEAWVRKSDNDGSLVNGRALGLVPENRFTVGGTARPFESFGEPYKGFRASMLGVFTGRQHPQSYESTAQATLDATGGAGHRIKSYSVWDFILAYDWRGYEVYFKVNNIFDEKYYSRSVSATSWGTAIAPAGTYNFVNPGAPREYVWGMRWEM